MKRPRLFVFPERQEFLLVYIPTGVPFELPRLTAPLTKQILADAIAPRALSYSITETSAGRYGRAMLLAKNAEAADAGNEARARSSAQAKILRSSNDPLEAQRAKALLDKNACLEELRLLRKQVNEARASVRRGWRVDPSELRKLEARLTKKQEEGIAYDTLLGNLREAIKQKAHRERQSMAQMFKTAAYEMLSPETFDAVMSRAEELLAKEEACEDAAADDDVEETTAVKKAK